MVVNAPVHQDMSFPKNTMLNSEARVKNAKEPKLERRNESENI